MLCNGNQTEYCGGSNRIDLYSGNGTLPTSASSSATATSSGIPGPTGLPSGWVSAGCWVDEVYGRIVQYQEPDDPTMTVESCVNTCADGNYTVAGVEFGVQCFCGYEIINAGTSASNQGDCSQACGGNSAEFCGGGNRMNIYHTGNLTVLGVPVPQTGGLDGWTYRGCRT
jgi:WSC domain